MKKLIALLFVATVTLLAGNKLIAQQTLSNDEISAYKAQAADLIKYYEGTLNFLASADAVTKEKEIIINESFSKIFVSDKVQIEDDLDENRKTFINKDVQAYLKDVDFFLNDAQFEFTIEDLVLNQNEKNELYFKVTTTCRLRGILLSKDTVNSVGQRFFEININDEQKDLRIASIYTTKLNEEEELKNWWTALSPEWKKVFSASVPVADPPTFEQLKKVTSLDRIDLAGKKLGNVDPLSRLSMLKHANINGNQLKTLHPLRNLAKLEHLDCANNEITELEALKYSTNLISLDISMNKISSIQEVENFEKLEDFDVSDNPTKDIKPISDLSKLKVLRLKNTEIQDLAALKNLKSVNLLIISGTKVSDISPVAGMAQLERFELDKSAVSVLSPIKNLNKLSEISFNNTQVSTLNDLANLPKLKKVYCDNTPMPKDNAKLFMAAHPGVLVIYASEVLEVWWKSLASNWRDVFASYVKLENLAQPTKEELHEIANLKKLNLAGNRQISSVEPLKQLRNLTEIIVARIEVADISALSELNDLKALDISFTKVSSIEALKTVKNLEILNLENTAVSSVEPLMDLKDLKIIYADSTQVAKEAMQKLIDKFPSAQIIYQTQEIRKWWDNLPDGWKKVFGTYVKINGTLTKEQLQAVANQEVIVIPAGAKIQNLEPLEQMVKLKEVRFPDTQVFSLAPLSKLTRLETIDCSKNPISSLTPLKGMKNLKYLDCSNTLVNKLDALKSVPALETLNCSGSLVKSLAGLESSQKLEVLEIYNTKIWFLKSIEGLKGLKTLKCYNTKIMKMFVDKYKKSRPTCDVIYY
jgi:Leucine-rich repeat (LRR) protein